MKIVETSLPGVLRVEPKVFGDSRGYFVEIWSQSRYANGGVGVEFVQDNLSKSCKGTLRGLHLQYPHSQGKLVHVVSGAVYDVAVDVRRGSPHFGRWVAEVLSEENQIQLYLPPGFAHGFCVLSEEAVFAYKCSDGYYPECELTVAFNDPALGIPWPEAAPIVSAKDRAGTRLADVPEHRLPPFHA
jgi:dTDP-4-dehydrorhamnose 3,5-epimerase